MVFRSNVSSYADLSAFCLVLLVGALLVWQADARQYLNVGTETDFIGGFQIEAARFMAGQAMELSFHPPGYPVLLAAVFSIVNDWFTAGLTVSVLSAIVVLAASYLCYRDLLGAPGGLGALAALLGSAVFLAFSIQSTSDILFLSIWCLALYAATIAMRQQAPWQWLALGLLISSGILTRTNGIVLSLLAIAPLITHRPLSSRLTNTVLVFAAMATPLLIWLIYSTITGSPFMPTKTYANLALTYFSTERISGDALRLVESQFTSSLDVLTTDPMRVLRIYLDDLYHLPGRLLRNATWPPLALLCLLCSLVWLTKLRDTRALLVLGVTLASMAVLNMKAFETRYYLHLLPVAGASIGLALTKLAHRGGPQWIQQSTTQTGALVLLSMLALGISGFSGFGRAENRVLSAQFQAMIPQIEQKTPRDAKIMCRKCNAAYHAQRDFVSFPALDTLEQLCAELLGRDSSHPVYIAIAEPEKDRRPKLSASLMSPTLPEWLELTAEGAGRNPWRLIRYKDQVLCK